MTRAASAAAKENVCVVRGGERTVSPGSPLESGTAALAGTLARVMKNTVQLPRERRKAAWRWMASWHSTKPVDSK